MIITKDISLENFEAWSGAKKTLEILVNENKVLEVENYLYDIFPEGCTETELNDFLWFETDFIFMELLGYNEEEMNSFYR